MIEERESEYFGSTVSNTKGLRPIVSNLNKIEEPLEEDEETPKLGKTDYQEKRKDDKNKEKNKKEEKE